MNCFHEKRRYHVLSLAAAREHWCTAIHRTHEGGPHGTSPERCVWSRCSGQSGGSGMWHHGRGRNAIVYLRTFEIKTAALFVKQHHFECGMCVRKERRKECHVLCATVQCRYLRLKF